MEEQLNINHFLGFCRMFLAFYVQVIQETGGMCYTTKSDTVKKANPSRVFRVILSTGYAKSGKRSVNPCKSVG
jgi:hypothetical protein